MNPLRPIEREDASGSDRQVSVGWGEENDTRAKRLATLSVLDRNPAGVADDMGQHTPLRWVPVLHHGDCGSEFGRQLREDMTECRDSPGRCPDDYHFEHRIGSQVGGRRRASAGVGGSLVSSFIENPGLARCGLFATSTSWMTWQRSDPYAAFLFHYYSRAIHYGKGRVYTTMRCVGIQTI